MRITNSMVTANTKTNININKMYHDKTNTMVASGQKIVRPSDDPVIAIRALRLNTSLSELKQFKTKNIPDAEAWFDATETALLQTDAVISDIQEKLNQAVSQHNNSQSVSDVLQELKQLRNQIYATGNADNAGRTVFTGYRTSETLTFQEPENTKYQIYEPVSALDIETIQYVSGTEQFDRNSIAIDKIGTSPLLTEYTEQNIQLNSVDRIRLAYDGLDGAQPMFMTRDKDGNVAQLDASLPPLKVVSIAGMSQNDIDDIYTLAGGDSVFIQETGEVILNKDYKDALIKAKDDNKNVEIYYEKSNWQEGDLRPEHYFMCRTPDIKSNIYKTDGIEYNFNRIDSAGNPTTDGTGKATGFKEQEMVYEIAFGQSIQINSHANDVYMHGMGRDVDELVNVMQEVMDSDERLAAIKEKLNSLPETDTVNRPKYESLYKAAQKENTFLNEKMHKMFQASQDSFKNYSNLINKEVSRIGAMTARLNLTKSRVEKQYSNIEELADKNINIDIDEIGLDYTSAKVALDAARLAAGQIAESTLLNYI